MSGTTPGSLLVIGGGIAGVTSAVEAAEAGHEVILVERGPSIGGRVLRNHRYFPKMCPPSCGMEINTRRVERNPRIRVMTSTEVVEAKRRGGSWHVRLKRGPEYVTSRCTACGDCAQVCPVKVPDPFNLGMSETTAIRLPSGEAWPYRYELERSSCAEGCEECVKACSYGAIDLGAEEKEERLEVTALVVATGWEPYPLERLRELGGGELADVISNVQMERLVSGSGPTGGKIERPSDGVEPKRVAFVQCAGSRDVNHLAYCSAVCCLASLKQALYVKEQLPEAEVTIYYIDRRAPGRNEDVLTKVAAMEGVRLVKGKVGQVTGSGGVLKLRVEDVESGRLEEAEADLVVLATGMVPSLRGKELGIEGLKTDEDGFVLDDWENRIFAAGVARRPEDVAASVRDATGASAKALMSGRSA